MSAVPLNVTLGALESGVMFANFLFGALTIQMYTYFSKFSNDVVKNRTQVALVWFCELGHAVCIIRTLYVLSVINYGNPESIIYPPHTLTAGHIFVSFVPPIVQTYFALRIYSFSKQPYIPVISCFLSLLNLIFNLVLSVAGITMTSIILYVDKWTWLLAASFFIRLVNDILITTTLVMYLYWRRGDTEFSSTLRMLDKLIQWTIGVFHFFSESSLYPYRNLCHHKCYQHRQDHFCKQIKVQTFISYLFEFFTMKYNYIWVSIFVFESGLFANSYLAALNSRLTLRAMRDDIVLIDTQFGRRSAYQPKHSPTSISVGLTRTVITDTSEPTTARSDIKEGSLDAGNGDSAKGIDAIEA